MGWGEGGVIGTHGHVCLSFLYMHSWVGTLQENTSPSGEGVCLEGCCLQLPGCTMRRQYKDGCSLCGMSSGGWFAESGS